MLVVYRTGAIFEATPDDAQPDPAAAPPTALRLLEPDEMRHLFQSYNALLNAGFGTPPAAGADRSGACPRYGQAVELVGLQARPELNGRRGVIDGVFDVATGRVAVVLEVVVTR